MKNIVSLYLILIILPSCAGSGSQSSSEMRARAAEYLACVDRRVRDHSVEHGRSALPMPLSAVEDVVDRAASDCGVARADFLTADRNRAVRSAHDHFVREARNAAAAERAEADRRTLMAALRQYADCLRPTGARLAQSSQEPALVVADATMALCREHLLAVPFDARQTVERTMREQVLGDIVAIRSLSRTAPTTRDNPIAPSSPPARRTPADSIGI